MPPQPEDEVLGEMHSFGIGFENLGTVDSTTHGNTAAGKLARTIRLLKINGTVSMAHRDVVPTAAGELEAIFQCFYLKQFSANMLNAQGQFTKFPGDATLGVDDIAGDPFGDGTGVSIIAGPNGQLPLLFAAHLKAYQSATFGGANEVINVDFPDKGILLKEGSYIIMHMDGIGFYTAALGHFNLEIQATFFYKPVLNKYTGL